MRSFRVKLQPVMKKMKRAAANSHQSKFADAKAGARSKQQKLLDDFLELQKEYVSKKKKLQIAKKKREILLAEVRFLRRKHKSFRIGSEALEREQDLIGPPNSYTRRKLLPESRKKYSVSESVLKSPSPGSDFSPVMHNEEHIRRKEEAVLNPLRVEKKPKNRLINKKRVGEKKTSWQDQVAF
ncbi:hypothetical protein ACOSQ3_008221 [Xanthoceras sorbifolium]